jgi:membrane fusion protein, multidrug efflux system
MKLTDSQPLPAHPPTATFNGHKQLDRESDLAAKGSELVPFEAGSIVSDPVFPPKRKPGFHPSKKQLLLLAIGLGVVTVAGIFGLRWWQFAQTHEETDNATVTGDIYPISARVNGNVAQVLVADNQQVTAGQTLVKLDPRDYQSRVTQAKAALETAKRQAATSKSNIQVAAQNAAASSTQAQGGVSNSTAGISSAQAALAEAQSGVPIAQSAVVQAQSAIGAAIAAVNDSQSAIPAAQASLAEAEAGVPAAQAQVAQIDANLIKAKADFQRYQNLQQAGAAPQQQLDTARATYQAALAQRSAAVQAVQQARSRVSQAKESIVSARAKLAQAQEGVARAKSQFAQAQSGVLQARSRVAQAQEGVNRAKAQLTTSQGTIEQARAANSQTDVNKSQYQAALANVAQAEATLKDAQLQLSYTKIIAPNNGRIGNKRVEVGQQTQSGTPLMAIVDNNPWVVANFKETQLSRMQPGQAVEVKIDSFPNHPFIGRLQSVAPASGARFSLLPPDNATGNFTKIVQRIPVKVVFDPQSLKGYESRIAPGMSATVSVELTK